VAKSDVSVSCEVARFAQGIRGPDQHAQVKGQTFDSLEVKEDAVKDACSVAIDRGDDGEALTVRYPDVAKNGRGDVVANEKRVLIALRTESAGLTRTGGEHQTLVILAFPFASKAMVLECNYDLTLGSPGVDDFKGIFIQVGELIQAFSHLEDWPRVGLKVWHRLLELSSTVTR